MSAKPAPIANAVGLPLGMDAGDGDGNIEICEDIDDESDEQGIKHSIMPAHGMQLHFIWVLKPVDECVP